MTAYPKEEFCLCGTYIQVTNETISYKTPQNNEH